MKKFFFMNADREKMPIEIKDILEVTTLVSACEKISAAWSEFQVHGEGNYYEMVFADQRIVIRKVMLVEEISDDFEEKIRVFILRGNDEMIKMARDKMNTLRKLVILLEEHVEESKSITEACDKETLVQEVAESNEVRTIVCRGQTVARVMFLLLVVGVAAIIGSVVSAILGV